jgi:hypothetical protein
MPRKRRRKVLTLRGSGIGRPPLYRAGSWCADTEQDRGAPTPSTDREAYEPVKLSKRSGHVGPALFERDVRCLVSEVCFPRTAGGDARG